MGLSRKMTVYKYSIIFCSQQSSPIAFFFVARQVVTLTDDTNRRARSEPAIDFSIYLKKTLSVNRQKIDEAVTIARGE